jgi:hypothetical protein
VNSKNNEDWERNFTLVNEILLKIKSFKQIDPLKLTKNKFNVNFEFLQFVYDFILKQDSKQQNIQSNIKPYDKRLEILKAQHGSKIYIFNSKKR